MQIGEEKGDAPAASQSFELTLTINTATDAPASWACPAVPNSPMISSTGQWRGLLGFLHCWLLLLLSRGKSESIERDRSVIFHEG